ncbi:hypothetical protein OHB25_49265 [Streptomyces mirabilis]|uniref:hypothetical protein n=1 Tax=Streptomyces TaxID=1883 RepID=UPI001162A082|nr:MULTISPECIES: hypothetical protein [Streptomyces]MCX4615912.1 hypothetical protein [Streptomyces mirabilis]MCX5347313.1 hypothetical protein [Streptomyces mirabilis]QDN86021.1 hypothetical protein FNV61_10775 [Streptomyces sp. RLB3-6]QDO06832.1 hypothetical protein FNV68_11875 [Streptomyces sp. S1D4-23]
MICAAQAALTIPSLVIGRMLDRAKDVAPTEINNHYKDTVHQDQRQAHRKTIGLSAKTASSQRDDRSQASNR